jgi:phage-related minor tail protein
MSDSTNFDTQGFDEVVKTSDTARTSASALGVSATQFATAMRKAFSDAVSGGKQFDDVLKSLALRLSNLALTNALKPLAKGLAGGFTDLFGGSGSGAATMPNIQPFASGGVIGAPSYFPLSAGGLGLAGEAGPEAIMPLTRGSDGRLGISMAGGAPSNVTVQIVTPDPASFHRSEAYLTGQIARAVARGQRNL